MDEAAILKYRRRSEADRSSTNDHTIKPSFSGNGTVELNKLFRIHARHLKSFDSGKAPSNLYFAKSLLDQQRMSNIDETTYMTQLKNTKTQRDFVSFSDFKKSW